MFTRSSLSVKLEIDLAPSLKNPSRSSCRHDMTLGGELNKENTWPGILEGVCAEASALLVKHCRIVNMKRALFKCWPWNFAIVDAMDTASSCWSVGLTQSGYTLILCHPFSADFKLNIWATIKLSTEENKRISLAVQSFILKTKRFQNQSPLWHSHHHPSSPIFCLLWHNLL